MVKLNTALGSAAFLALALASASANAALMLTPTDSLQSYTASKDTVIDFDYSLDTAKKLITAESYVGSVFVTSQSFGPFTGTGIYEFGSIGPDVTLDYQLSPVPEPASWAMLVLGLGGAGAMFRRRRSIAASAQVQEHLALS